MAHYWWLRWYITLIQCLTAPSQQAPTLQPRLGHDEVQFGLAGSTTSKHHIVSIAVKVGALLDVWHVMGGCGGM